MNDTHKIESRIYKGIPAKVTEEFSRYDIANGPGFAGHVSIIMGVFYKRSNELKFNAIGEPAKDKKLEETIKTVATNHL